MIRGCLDFCGKLMDIGGLAHVWVTYDYEGTLATLERGFETDNALMPTQDEISVGIAMTPAVMRDGALRSVMVLNATYMQTLMHPDDEELKPLYRRTIYTLAHECGHAHDLGVKWRSFLDQWLKLRLNRYDGVLFEIAEACWSEYIACRLSAAMAPDDITVDYENTLCKQMNAAFLKTREFLRAYRMHREISRVFNECCYVVRKVLVYASYLFGQLAGIGETLEKGAPRVKALLEPYPPVRSLLARLESELENMNNAYGDWVSLDMFEPIKEIALNLFAVVGLRLQNRGDRECVSTSFRADPF